MIRIHGVAVLMLVIIQTGYAYGILTPTPLGVACYMVSMYLLGMAAVGIAARTPAGREPEAGG